MKTKPVHHTCAIHPGCHVYWRPDPKLNRLRGRSIHIPAWVLFDGELYSQTLFEPAPGDEVMVKLPNVRVRGPIFWSKEELRKARGY